MPRKRDPAREQAHELWLASNKQLALKDIADQLGKKPSTIRKWKAEDNWDGNAKRSAPFERERSFSNHAAQKVAEADIPEKRKVFATLYLQRFNATWAYLQAYGGSQNVAAVEGSRLLRNPKVVELLNELKKEHARQLDITAMDVLTEVAKQANANIGDFLDFATEEHTVFDSKGKVVMDPETRKPQHYYMHRVNLKPQAEVDTSLIKTVAIEKGHIRLELYDKQRAQEVLLKALPAVGDGLMAAQQRKAKADADVAQSRADIVNTPEGETSYGLSIDIPASKSTEGGQNDAGES